MAKLASMDNGGGVEGREEEEDNNSKVAFSKDRGDDSEGGDSGGSELERK